MGNGGIIGGVTENRLNLRPEYYESQQRHENELRTAPQIGRNAHRACSQMGQRQRLRAINLTNPIA